MSAIHEWFGYTHAIYTYIQKKYGPEELDRYFDYLAREAYCDVTIRYRVLGLEAIRDRYVGNFRKDGDESSAQAQIAGDTLTMQVHCPAFTHTTPTKNPDRCVTPFLCDCCRQLNGKILHEAGYRLELTKTGCGRCRWEIRKEDD